jgi:uncharacterized protein (TIGR02147 family)
MTKDPAEGVTTDWRGFVRARARSLGLSLRGLAGEAGVTPSWLSNVLSGTRGLDPQHVPMLAAAMRLDGPDTELFEALVDLETGSPRARRAAWALIAARSRQSATALPPPDGMDLLSRWYIPVVMELARCEGFRADPEWIAHTVRPPITPEEAQEALTVLLARHMLAPDDAGNLVPTGPELWFPSDLPPGKLSELTGRYYEAMLGAAAVALRTTRRNERRITGVMAAISEQHYERIASRLADLEREIVAVAAEDPGPPNRVFHLGIQFFPVSEYSDAE